MEIEEYVRTKNGLLGRVNKIELKGSGVRYAGEFITDTIIQFNDGKVYERRVRDKDIIKHSKNIIDLIENEDILKIKTKENEILFIGVDENTTNLKYEEVIEELKNEEYELLGILTKEQYEANCYNLED